MASFKKRYDTSQKKKALKLLQELQKRIQSGELVVDVFGRWQGSPRTWTFKFVTKETENEDGLVES